MKSTLQYIFRLLRISALFPLEVYIYEGSDNKSCRRWRINPNSDCFKTKGSRSINRTQLIKWVNKFFFYDPNSFNRGPNYIF